MKLKNILISAVLAAGCVFGLTGCSGTSAGNILSEMTFSEGDKIAEITIENYGTIKVKLFPDIAPVGVDNFIKLAESGYYNGLKIHRVAKDMCIQGGSLNGDGTGGAAVVNKSGYFPIEVSQDARNFYGALGYAANESGLNTTQFYIVNCKKQADITQYSAAAIRDKAAEYTEKISGLESGSTETDILTAEQAYYTNLADMIENASEEVVNRYATTGGYPLWDGGYTIFGQVFDGFDVLDKLSEAEVTSNRYGEISKPISDIVITSVTVTDYVPPQSEDEDTDSSK